MAFEALVAATGDLVSSYFGAAEFCRVATASIFLTDCPIGVACRCAHQIHINNRVLAHLRASIPVTACRYWSQFLSGPEVGLLSEIGRRWRAKFSLLNRYYNWPVPEFDSIAQAQQRALAQF